MEEGHNLTVEQCKKISASGIISVDAFSDKQISLTYAGGKISVSGNGMKITNFSKTSGAFSATGEITGVRYSAKSASFRQKLFK